MTDNIHVVELGDGWEVRRLGDSMPLGTYLTQGEAEEHARAAARDGDAQVVDHELDIEVDDEEPTVVDSSAVDPS